ncbi:hypothetical protein PENTCL1PPCAC_13447 [Pristionchus entomophagus]|uniref:G protein-coupled receptor n=1 Tax=Pristionchus entomophagus TaxID=358040 RepID=A0AAV5T6T0_9BILA|nr:hypothetical protein PENTCL1PPCAC_13447 [Pristionchus entomophagus]
MAGRVRTYIAIFFEILILCVVISLLLINKQRARRFSHDFMQLTSRYQLAENIRACRFLQTFVLFDSMITVVDAVADIAFSVSF